MTNLQRLTGKIFGETATATGDDPQIGQFGSALAGTYVGTTDVSEIQSLPAWSNGFIDSVTPSTQFPPLPEMTGVCKVLSHQTSYLLQKGIAEYDSNTMYYIGDLCKGINSGTIYESIADENINNSLIDTTKWRIAGGADVNLSNLTNLGHAKLQYAPFAVNAGTMVDGENATLSYSGSDLTCSACTITTTDGRTKEFTSSAVIDVSTQADGTYNVLKDYSTGELSLVSNLAISKTVPDTPSNGDCWVDTSVMPANFKVYNGSSWNADNDKVYLGDVTVESNVIKAIRNRQFNDSGYLINRYYPVNCLPDWDNKIDITAITTTFTCPNDGILYLRVYSASSTRSEYGWSSSIAGGSIYAVVAQNNGGWYTASEFIVRKDEVLTYVTGSSGTITGYFIPFKGV